MKPNDYVQILIFALALILVAPFLGSFMFRVFNGENHFLKPVLGSLEKLTYRFSGIRNSLGNLDGNDAVEMNWREYLRALLIFNFIGFVAVLIFQVGQHALPLNPQELPAVSLHSALNTAISFMTNTNWQGYSGETTMSYLTQMLALTVQNFVSAATGIAVFLALARGISRKLNSKSLTATIGNFWVDLTRSVVYVLLPFSIVLAIVLVGQGVVQNFSSYQEITTVEGAKQVLPGGPAASQIAIKQLGTNGGGFFNANSAHPFENPTPFSNWLQMFALLMIPAALTFTYGRIVGSMKQGWTIFAVMFVIWSASLVGSLAAEYGSNQVFTEASSNFSANPNLEGKETRFGIVNSIIWSTATTAASNGSVNAMHSSLSPLAGGLAMFNIMLGEIVFGGVGAGLYGMLLFVLLTVFLSGLMVGRTPEYLGKKIEANEMKWAILGILGPCAVILVGTAISAVSPVALSSLANKGPHGFSEILYAFSSAAGNNGSAFAGLNANTVYFNLMLGLAMLVGRFVVIVPALAIAGSLANKKISPVTSGTFATDGLLFGVLLIGVIVIVGALTFLPALSLGPIVEHFLMLQGHAF